MRDKVGKKLINKRVVIVYEIEFYFKIVRCFFIFAKSILQILFKIK